MMKQKVHKNGQSHSGSKHGARWQANGGSLVCCHQVNGGDKEQGVKLLISRQTRSRRYT